MFKNISKKVYLITMKINLQKGFTLIELLVVVAIIGILSSIVLVSLNSAREKARDSSAKGSMSSIRAAAEIYYDTEGGRYTGLCGMTPTDPIIDLLVAVEDETGVAPICRVSTDGLAYAVSAELNATDRVFCVDSTGFAGDFIGIDPVVDLPSGATECTTS